MIRNFFEDAFRRGTESVLFFPFPTICVDKYFLYAEKLMLLTWLWHEPFRKVIC